MKVQTKVNLGIIIVFALLAVGIAIISVNFVNSNTIRGAENRVRIYARAAWEIHDSKIERVRSATEILAQDQIIRDLLQAPKNGQFSTAALEYLETFRMEQGMDILDLLTPNGTVILRTRSPSRQAGRDSHHVEENGPDNKIRIAVQDDGQGMDAQTLAHITDPFVTSRITRVAGW